MNRLRFRSLALPTLWVAGILLVLPASTALSQAGQFDGTWRITQQGDTCMIKRGGYTFTVANGAIRGRMTAGSISGTVSASGEARWTHPAVADGKPVNWSGTFRGSTGSGSYARADGKCAGTFTAKRG